MQDYVKIRKLNGVPRLFVDERPMPGTVFRCRQHDHFEYMKQFADSGTELFFMTHLRNWSASWEQHFEEVARRLDGILKFNPRIHVVLGLFLSTSREWAAEHPEEVCWKNGRPAGSDYAAKAYLDLPYLTSAYSMGSEAFDEVAREHVNRSLDFLEGYAQARRVIGLFLEGGVAQEWIPFCADMETWGDGDDTGPAAMRAFRRFLEQKYKNEEALREAWQDARASFSTLTPPTTEEKQKPTRGDYFLPRSPGQRVADWHQAIKHGIAQRMLNSAKAVKDRRPDLLAGFFHEPLFPEQGGYANQFERALGLVLTSGAMTWHWQFQDNWFGTKKRWFDLNRNINAIARLCLEHHCRSRAEVLVVVDEASADYMRAGSRVVKNQVERTLTFEFGHLGAPVDVMLPSTLLHPETDLSSYKLVFILNNHLATLEQRRAFEVLKGGGRTIVFGHGAGYLSDGPGAGGSVEHMRALTGFEFEDLDLYWAPTITIPDTVEWLAGDLPLGFTFGQCYRTLRALPDGKGKPLFPPVTHVAPVFSVSDPQAEDLGYYNLEMDAKFSPAARTQGAVPFKFPGDTKYYCGMATKKFETWRSVYAGATLLPAALLRAFARRAGVHLYLDSEDIVYANDKLLVLHTNEHAGLRELRFPKRCNVYDLKEGWKEIARGVDGLKLDCEPRRTWLLWLADLPPKYS